MCKICIRVVLASRKGLIDLVLPVDEVVARCEELLVEWSPYAPC
jgi:hypothetical protein